MANVDSRLRNRLLASLPAADFQSLALHLTVSPFDQGVLLQETEDLIQKVYFPCEGMISLLVVMRTGDGVETATIGEEGAVNLMAGFGSRNAVGRAVMQVSGEVAHISAAQFRVAVGESRPLHDLVVRYNDVHLGLLQQTVGCNALHQVESRLCRWLLQTRDRCHDDQLPLTHEFLSQMLGVQRTSVTAIANTLQALGLIYYRRGRIRILDRVGLEKKSCECYQSARLISESVYV